MNQSASTFEPSKRKRWPVRATLYQIFVLFSIVAVILLQRRIETQQAELRTKRATLFSLNRDLYVDDPHRMAGIQRFASNAHEINWSVYVPQGTQGKLFVEGKVVAELTGGTHQIRGLLRRDMKPSGPAIVTVEKLLVDDQPYEVKFLIFDFFDFPDITAPTTASPGEKLPLLTKPGNVPEVQMWVEAD